GPRLHVSGGELRDVDDRHFRVEIGDAITIRREVSRDFFTHHRLHLHELNERPNSAGIGLDPCPGRTILYTKICPTPMLTTTRPVTFASRGRLADAFSQSIIKG